MLRSQSLSTAAVCLPKKLLKWRRNTVHTEKEHVLSHHVLDKHAPHLAGCGVQGGRHCSFWSWVAGLGVGHHWWATVVCLCVGWESCCRSWFLAIKTRTLHDFSEVKYFLHTPHLCAHTLNGSLSQRLQTFVRACSPSYVLLCLECGTGKLPASKSPTYSLIMLSG